jgi:hypothetical protein
VIAARRGDHTGFLDVSSQQVGERAPRLERAGVLLQLQFEAQASRFDPEIRAIDFDDRCPPDPRPDQVLGLGNVVLLIAAS